MKRFGQILLVGLLVIGISGVAFGQCPSTLDKIKNSGVFTLGVRNGSPPFSFINKQNERVGFSERLGLSWFTRRSRRNWENRSNLK